MITNKNPAIRTINLNHNLIEDKGKVIFYEIFNSVSTNFYKVKKFLKIKYSLIKSMRFQFKFQFAFLLSIK